MGSDSTNDDDRDWLRAIQKVDEERDDLAKILSLFGGRWNESAAELISLGFRRAPSAPTPPLPESPGEFARLHAAWVTARQCLRDLRCALTWTEVREILTAYDQRNHAPTPPEAVLADMMIAAGYPTPQSVVDNLTAQRDAAEEQIAYWQRAAHEIEQEMTVEHDAAVQRAEKTERTLASLKQLWDDQCAHVEEACRLLGVDTEETPGDSWTLREWCVRVIAQRNVALADAAAMRAILTEIMRSNGRVTVGVLRSINDIITAAPAAKGTT